jgi:hypothetical protein
MRKATVENPGFVSGSPRKRPERGKGKAVRRKRVVIPFDPKAFLAKVGGGKLFRTTRKTRLYFHREKLGRLFLHSEGQDQAHRRF